MDRPSARKIHQIPTPRFGGIAFSLVIIILGWSLVNTTGIYTWYFLGALGMFILGAIDDYFRLSWHFKLPIQIFIGGMIVIQLFPYIDSVIFFDYSLPFSKLILSGLFVFWFIGISNSINLIDGMDGLSGGFMFLITFSAGILGFISGNENFIYINVLFTAALLAFLHYNQKPAKFFMGDSGSLFLGYHLAVLPLLFVVTGNGINKIVDMTPFILLSTYLIADTIRVFVLRLRKRKHPLEPDQLHLHYQFYNQGHSHNGTLMAIFILCGFGCLLAVSAIVSTVKSTNLMLLYLTILGVCTFVSQVHKNFINIVIKINNRFRKKNIRNYSILSFFNINLLPYIIGFYFISLVVLYHKELYQLTNFPVILIIITIFSLLLLQDSFKIYSTQTAILISIGILQVDIMALGVNELYSNINNLNVETIFIWIKYGSLLLASIITITNYIMNSEIYSGEFWSVTDLLVIFLLVGMIGLQPLGVGFPATFSFEIGLVYFANKLWLPQLTSVFSKEQITA